MRFGFKYLKHKISYMSILEEDWKKNWGTVVFYSTIDRWRNKTQISKEWDLSVSGGVLYQEEGSKETKKLCDEGLIEPRGKTFYADFNSKAFKELLREILENEAEKEGASDVTSKMALKMIDNIEEFIEFLDREEIRERVLSLENIKEVYNENTQTLRKFPHLPFKAVISGFAVVWVEDRLGEMEGSQPIIKMMKGAFEGVLDQTTKNSPGNTKVIIDAMKEVYEETPEIFSFANDIYDELGEDVSPF